MNPFDLINTILIGIIGTIFTYKNYQLNERRRKDELFDRRFAFYKRLCKIWLSTAVDDEPELELENLLCIIDEARFLFDEDIVNHILALEGKYHTGHPSFPNDDFVKPFNKYLHFEK